MGYWSERQPEHRHPVENSTIRIDSVQEGLMDQEMLIGEMVRDLMERGYDGPAAQSEVRRRLEENPDLAAEDLRNLELAKNGDEPNSVVSPQQLELFKPPGVGELTNYDYDTGKFD
jgi:hypothetical protein